MAWTNPSTASVGGAVTAALWNSDVRDNMTELAPFSAAWTSYTPTFTQNVSVTPTVNYAKYVNVGKLVIGSLKMTATSSGTSGQPLKITLPFAPASNLPPVAYGYFYNGTVFGIVGTLISGSTIGFDAYTQPGGGFGSAVSFQVVNGNSINISFQYETA